MGEIQRNPEYELASKQLEEAKERLLSLLLEIGELEQHICKNIEADYMLKVGCYEYKVFEHQTALLRLKRKIELVQKKLNHNETPEFDLIEEQLDCEYRNYEERLKEQLEALNGSLERRRGRILDEGETLEVKALYRGLVKRLHPDLHPGISSQYLRMFRNTVDAYACGDIAVLRALDIASRTLPSEVLGSKNSMQMLEKQRALTAFQIGLAEVRIGDIKGEYPYVEREFLEDDERVAGQVRELLEIISGFEEEYVSYARKLGDLVGGQDE